MTSQSRFSAGLGRLDAIGGKAKPTPPATAVLEADPVTASIAPAGARVQQQPSRAGKVNISGYFDPAVRKQIALLAAEQGRNKAELMAEALNLLFEKYDRPPIARA